MSSNSTELVESELLEKIPVKIITIGHIISPVFVQPGNRSYLDIAQPITFQTMLDAQKIAHETGNIQVSLYTAQYEEDRCIIPVGFNITSDLTISSCSVMKSGKITIKLPLMGDIIARLYANSDAEYFIYTNVDISLRPDFYVKIANYLRTGYDSICVHRKDVPTKKQDIILDISNYELVLNTAPFCGDHPGHDCLIFRRDIVPKMKFNRVFVGFPPVGAVLKCQITRNSNKFLELKSSTNLTFHLGRDVAWAKKNPQNAEYKNFNYSEARSLYSHRG